MRHFFSDLNAFQRDPLSFLLERGNGSQPGLVPLALGPRPHFLVTDPDLAKSILKSGTSLVDKGRLVQKLRPFIGDSFLLSTGSKHVQRREVLHHQLARGVAQRYVPEMSTVIRQVAAALVKEGQFNAHEISAPLTLNLICVALFGHDALASGDKQALIGALKMIEDEIADEMFRATPLSPWTYLARRKRRTLARETMSFVVNRVRRNAGSSSLLRALEDLKLTDRQITDEILTMLVAGHHTTGTVGAWILYHLAMDPELADEVAGEAYAICTDTGEIAASKLKDAKTSLALVREVLRLYPSAWWFSRETKCSMEIGGHKLKPGTSFIISPWQMHRNPEFWTNPSTFDISRSHANPAYMPFGFGPRVCVGMGVALLELQLLALEFSSAFRLSNATPIRAPWPKASVTLIPPAIEIGLRVRTHNISEVVAA